MLLPLRCWLLSEFNAGAEDSLAEALQGRGHNTLKTAQRRNSPPSERALKPCSEDSSQLRQGKVWKSPEALGAQLPAEEREGTELIKCQAGASSHPPYSNKSLNFSESSKSPYPSGLKADLQEYLLTDCPHPGSFLMHIS